jgi:hypothetical protein
MSDSGESSDEQTFDGWCEQWIDFNAFPDPSTFMNLAQYNIKTEEEFIRFWKKEHDQTITGFRSFTPPDEVQKVDT